MTAAQASPIDDLPAWLREVDVALAANPQLLLTGNLRDLVLWPRPDAGHPPMMPVVDALLALLELAGHTNVVVADPVDGARAALDTGGFAGRLVTSLRSGPAPLVDVLPELLAAVVTAEQPCCLIVDGASRLVPENDFSTPELHRVLVAAEKLMATAPRVAVPGPHRTSLYNTVFWLLDREGDLPHWLIGEYTRVVSIPMPGLAQRADAVRTLVGSLPDAPPAADEQARAAIVTRYAEQTSGLTLRAIREINRLAIDRRIPAAEIADAVRTFRIGVPDNPWQDAALKDRIRRGVELLGRDVLGQPAAVRKTVDILIRSAMGLTGAQTSGNGSRPQGLLFFAGPTGVGKTELAKAIAELVFGRKDAFLRFDMSEFSAEHTEARLIGAPPGYTGHNSGGELTNAVRQRPFQLILFDEIEKAHPRILDKFLQILEDGRLTDGTGATVFFSETLIVFTSNLGVYRTDESGERRAVITRGSEYGAVEATVRAAVADHFTRVIGRPELLNRMGDNIVVFDFISEETVRALVPKFVCNVVQRVRDATGIVVSVAPRVLDQLVEGALTRLEFGGRGVSTTVETLLVNPLARSLFETPPAAGRLAVTELVPGSEGWSVVCK
ncbi:AAA family ATPase [Nocardia sp. BMG111209]|uniref:AAA family ATPase n=1 Tax=Nocardia sp. BMG111209 TaxID=1160137 RepID=UPI00038222A3|nr:AAA family ATPase [Nocardia sp. BMG111209]